jgi:chromosome segregation ATPase
LSAKLKQVEEELSAKSSELDEARSLFEGLRGELQDSLAAQASLSDKIAYSTREQQSLRVRVTELLETVQTSRATLDQQHQLINNQQTLTRELAAERDQLQGELVSRDEQVAALHTELEAAGQAIEALAAARVEIGTHRDALTRLEAALGQLQTLLQAGPANPD